MEKLYQCLIVEDEPYSAKLIASYLKNYHNFYTPRFASSKEEARDEIRKGKYDMIFMDIHLLDGTAFDLLKASAAHTPVILVTGDKTQALAAYGKGVVDYLIKPVTKQRFDQAVVKLLEVIAGKKQIQSRNDGVPKISQNEKLESILINRYNLTPAECAICRSIANGAPPEKIQETHGIGINTWKTHLKRIYAKTIDMGKIDAKKKQGKLQQLTWFLLDLQNRV